MDPIVIKEHGALLYQMDTRGLADEACFCRNYGRLSAARRAKIDSYCYLRDKRLSMGAGMLLDRGLSQYGLREASAVFAYGKYGKPYLLEYPEIHFNLSHSEEMVLAVFAKKEAGCDIERIRRADLDLAKRFFCPAEYQYVIGQESGEQRNRAFYRIWTLKESFLKATGLGMSMPLHEFEIQIAADGDVRVCQNVKDASYGFREFCFGEYQAAVCFSLEQTGEIERN